MSLKTVSVASVEGDDMSVHDLLSNLKMKGRLRPLIREAVLDKVIAQAVKHEQIQVGTQELQQAANAFRVRSGLHKAADLERWLARMGITALEFETGLERGLQTRKLAAKVVTQEQVDKFFADNRTRFDRARLRHLVVAKEGLANELLTQLREDGADFAAMAKEHSLDKRSRPPNGRRGMGRRRRLDPAMAAVAFSAQKGAVIGPFKTPRGHVLLKVEEVIQGQLNPRTTTVIRRLLFRQWLRERVRTAKVQVRLHQHL